MFLLRTLEIHSNLLVNDNEAQCKNKYTNMEDIIPAHAWIGALDVLIWPSQEPVTSTMF